MFTACASLTFADNEKQQEPPSFRKRRNAFPPTLELLQPPTITISDEATPAADAIGTAIEAALSPPADLAVTPPTAEASPAPRAATASPRRSSRIQKLYNGARVGSIERASKRKAALSSSDSAMVRHSCSSSRRKKTKVQHAASIVELPLQGTPKSLNRDKRSSDSFPAAAT